MIPLNMAVFESFLLFFATTCIFMCDAETGLEESKMNLILEELTSLRKTVFALENMVHHQSDLIDDLKERNIIQERRISELEAAQHRKDKVCDEMKIRLEKTESRLHSHFSVSSGPTNITTKSTGDDIPEKRIIRSGRLLMSTRSTGMPPYEEGVIAFYAQMSSSEVSPSTHHTLIFDKVRTNVGNGYNGITGVFTAPKEGIYAFIWVIRMHEAEHSTELMINNDILGATFLRAKNNDDGSVSGTAIAHVGRGDVVFVRIHSTYGGDGNVLSNVHGMPTFSGWLLH